MRVVRGRTAPDPLSRSLRFSPLFCEYVKVRDACIGRSVVTGLRVARADWVRHHVALAASDSLFSHPPSLAQRSNDCC